MIDNDTHESADIVIAGGGLAGLSLAVAIKDALGADVRIILADPALAVSPPDNERAAAFAAAACNLFRAVGAWPDIEPHAQPILDMIVTDSRTMDPVRPTFLTFAGTIGPEEPFAHMAPNAAVARALWNRARSLGVTMLAAGIDRFEATASRVTATTSKGATISASLLVASDGGRSRVRELAGIRTVGWNYGQSGIVCTVAHDHDHEGRAEEHFLPAGPFAILPLKGRRSSIVWTEDTAKAARLCALPPILFQDELETRFGHRLGAIQVVDKPVAYPLGLQIARDFVADRLALVGDAAHVIHPIAGQGINMGFRDVAALAECVVETMRLGLDPGAADVLVRYQRWRRFDTVLMGATTDGLNRLFSNGSEPLRAFRDLGLGLVDRLPRLKNFFIRQAAGITGEVPRLMRGEAI